MSAAAPKSCTQREVIRRSQPPGELQNPHELRVLTSVEVKDPAVNIIGNGNIHLHLSCRVRWRLPQLCLMLYFLCKLGNGLKMRRTIAGRGCGDLVGKPRRECCAGSILGHKDAQGSVYFCDWCEDKLMIAKVTCF